MNEFKPLTPAFRNEINQSIDNNMRELDTCQTNAFVSAQKIGLQALRGIINSLPDGYPIPIERKGDSE